MSDHTFEITALPGEPFFEGESSNVGAIPGGFPISLNGRPFLADLSREKHGYRFQRSQIALLNAQQQATDGDNTLVQPEVWRRSQESWHLGMGQSRADRADSLPQRYFESYGIDVWDKYRLTLLNDTENVLALPAGRSHMVTLNSSITVVAVGTAAWWVPYGGIATSFTLTSPVVSMTSDGTYAYLLLASGSVVKVTNPTTLATLATLPLAAVDGQSFIRYTKSRLLAGSENRLYEVTSGSVTTIYTHPLASYRWIDACDGLSVAYVLGGTGDRWHIHRLSIDEASLQFSQPIVASPLPEGEIGYCIASYLGYVVVGLNTGWRFALPAGNGDLSYGRLISTDAPVEAFEGQDRFVWYGKSSSLPGLGRADLSSFIAPNTPAYANDIFSGELTTHRVGNIATLLTGAGTLGLRTFTLDGVGLFVETNFPVASGSIDFSGTGFGTSDDKRGVYLSVDWEKTAGTVKAWVSYDSSNYLQIAESATDAAEGTGNVAISESFRTFRLQLVLESVNDQSPAVNRWEVRALPVYGKSSEWRIPILLHDELSVGERTVNADPRSDYDFLVALAESRSVFTYREMDRTWQVYATDYLWEPWRETRNGETYQGLFVISLREIR